MITPPLFQIINNATTLSNIDNATSLSNNLVLTWENRIPLLEQNYHTVLNRLRTRVNALQNDTFNLQNDPRVDNFNPSLTDEFITHIENQNTLNQQEASILSMLIRLRRFYPIINNQRGGSLPQAREFASILLTLRAELQIIQNHLPTFNFTISFPRPRDGARDLARRPRDPRTTNQPTR